MKGKKPCQGESGFHHKRGLGQNFIEDEALLEKLCDLSLVTREDDVLEIGAGFGSLTKPLAKRAGRVVALEIDRTLIPILQLVLNPHQNARVLCADVMRTDLARVVRESFGESASLRVAANLPYYITTDVLFKLMRELPQAKSIAVMVQREVADKLFSGPGDDGYGPLALLCQLRYEMNRALEVPADCFTPPPKVDSTFVVLVRRAHAAYPVKDEALLERLIKGAFSMRRKTLVNNLVSCFALDRGKAVDLLAAAGIDAQVRAEALTLEEFCALSTQIGTEISTNREIAL